jgi:hypothetical protein
VKFRDDDSGEPSARRFAFRQLSAISPPAVGSPPSANCALVRATVRCQPRKPGSGRSAFPALIAPSVFASPFGFPAIRLRTVDKGRFVWGGEVWGASS